MPVHVALLRAVNVGGTGVLAMAQLVSLCEACGFRNVRTYIQSGNVVLESASSPAEVQAQLRDALEKKVGKTVEVIIRTSAELQEILKNNPFAEMPPAKVAVIFLQASPPSDLESLPGPSGEQVRCGAREVYIYYPEGMGRSKLKLPASIKKGTARNVNTVAKIARMAHTDNS